MEVGRRTAWKPRPGLDVLTREKRLLLLQQMHFQEAIYITPISNTTGKFFSDMNIDVENKEVAPNCCGSTDPLSEIGAIAGLQHRRTTLPTLTTVALSETSRKLAKTRTQGN